MTYNIINHYEFIWYSVFSNSLWDGNSTIVYRLPGWPNDEVLKSLAMYSGVDEATFFTYEHGKLEVRWFMGSKEVPLCGHGALALAKLFKSVLAAEGALEVNNLSGRLSLANIDSTESILLNEIKLTPLPIVQFQLNIEIIEAYDAGRDYLFIVKDFLALQAYQPDIRLKTLDKIGCIFSSEHFEDAAAFRFFVPQMNLFEDRASASVLPALLAYWGKERNMEYVFSQESGFSIQLAATKIDTNKIMIKGNTIEYARGKLSEEAINQLLIEKPI